MRAFVCWALAAGCLLSAPVSAQVQTYDVPLSADIVQLRVVRADAEAEVRVQNGGLARLGVSGGPSLGLTPVIVETGVAVVVAALSRDATTGNERIRYLRRVNLPYDEPTRIEMQRLIMDLWHEVETTVLIVIHSIAEAVFLGDRVWVMAAGPGRIAREFSCSLASRAGTPQKSS